LKNADAMASIEKALAVGPSNREYLELREQIKKHLAAPKKKS